MKPFRKKAKPGPEEKNMAFFNSAVTVLQTFVIALGSGPGVRGIASLLEGCGNDNPRAKSQGMKQLMGWRCLKCRHFIFLQIRSNMVIYLLC